MTATTHGRAQVTDVEAAVERDGTITALRMHVVADLGAYPIFTFIPDLALMMGVGVYRIPNIDLRSTCVFTNTTPVAAYRGAGRPEGCYYLERMVDIAARARRAARDRAAQELHRPRRVPVHHADGTALRQRRVRHARWRRRSQVSKYDALRAEQAARLARGDRKLLGIGMACYVEMCGFGPFESAMVRVEPTGTVTAYTGTSATRPGSRDDLRPDHRRPSRRRLRPGRGAARRHVEHAHGQRHRRQPEPGGRRLVHPAGGAEGAGAGACDRRRTCSRRRRTTWSSMTAGTRSRASRPAPDAGPDRRACLRGRAARLDRIRASRRPTSSGRRSSSTPSAPTSRSSRSIATPGRSRSATSCRSTTAASASARCWSTGQVHGGLAQGIAQALLEEVVYDARRPARDRLSDGLLRAAGGRPPVVRDGPDGHADAA